MHNLPKVFKTVILLCPALHTTVGWLSKRRGEGYGCYSFAIIMLCLLLVRLCYAMLYATLFLLQCALFCPPCFILSRAQSQSETHRPAKRATNYSTRLLPQYVQCSAVGTYSQTKAQQQHAVLSYSFCVTYCTSTCIIPRACLD